MNKKPIVTIKINNSEKDEVLDIIRQLQDVETRYISVKHMARNLRMNENRLRYIIDELLAEDKIVKVPIKASGSYKRYNYRIQEAWK